MIEQPLQLTPAERAFAATYCPALLYDYDALGEVIKELKAKLLDATGDNVALCGEDRMKEPRD